MSQEVTLEFRLLREWFIWTMASFPAAIVTVPLGAFDGVHVAGDKMLLKSTGTREGDSAGSFGPVTIVCPFADMQVIVLGRKVRGGQD
jgi:hypothetical protein